MSRQGKKLNLDFVFECDHCAESWSENLLDLIDRCTNEELLSLLGHVQNKLKKKSKIMS